MDETIKTCQNSENSNFYEGHVLVVCSPLQGHAAPLMKLSHHIAKLGTKVTFLCADSTCSRMIESNQGLQIISMPDGLELADDNIKDQKKSFGSFHKALPGYLEDLLKKTNKSAKSDDRISGAIIDMPLAMIIGIPKKMGIKTATFWCSSPGCLSLGLQIPHLVDAQLIDSDDGTPLQNELKIKLLPNRPDMTTTDLIWYSPGDINKQKSIFHFTKTIFHHMKIADWILCNWFHELEPTACTLAPNLLSLGPLLSNGQCTGSFCSEDTSCVTWLDKQSQNSVVYVAFGSTPRFSRQQLEEIANGLELMGRPFLWVAWPGLSNGSFPVKRVGDRGKIVEWAPQEMVLGHPSISCFVTHCGWNSFMESLSAGVPLLCWPYFGDQLYTRTCICDAWRIGISLERDENGIVLGDEIVKKVGQLVSDGIIRENVVKLKGMARKSVSKGGSSLINLQYMIQQMKC